ncbi:hypothetical protein CSB20_09705 [bacterium DOLZORAL124_64_63]|nr:MAG: hypothetical protein CSB20_09705 [bacterium DOLZORAL124_64_63]
MKIALSTALSLLLLLNFGPALSQDEPAQEEGAPAPESAALEAAEEDLLEYSDYMAKAYALTPYFGNFSGATYLENQRLSDRTVLTQGAGDIIGYDGEVLTVSQDVDHYDAAIKKIESGPAFGIRFAIYANKDFHLDLIGGYATGKAVTSMLYTPDPDNRDIYERRIVDEDDGYSLVKGGVHLGYDAHTAAFWGFTPKLGFGLGGLINRYTVLADKGALYLEGNFGLQKPLFKNLDLIAQADLTTFAYEVDELGYSNMVNYVTYSIGLSYFIDVIPNDVKTRYQAELEAREER